MRPIPLVLAASILIASCVSSPPTRPNDREWSVLLANYQAIDALRNASPAPGNATRKQQIELLLENHRKLAPTYDAFFDTKLRDYYERTGDPRAAQLYAREKIILGDEYMNVLARYDKAIEMYNAALTFDPENAAAKERIALARSRRFASMDAFVTVKAGMKEEQVRRIVGLPREDWIKQVVQNNRVYSVWIYPKRDGGASAIYFDNGVVYHTNWNAAAPAASK